MENQLTRMQPSTIDRPVRMFKSMRGRAMTASSNVLRGDGLVPESALGNPSHFLDDVATHLRSDGPLNLTMDELSDGLFWIRKNLGSAAWAEWVETALEHDVRAIVHEDPFTHRSFAKPRGYAGDAELLDMIYYDQGFFDHSKMSATGARIFYRNRDAPAPIAVRERRDHLAAQIDRCALRKSGARVLAVAAGHLREIEKSQAVLCGATSRFAALDADRFSLEEVRRRYGTGIETIHASVKDVLDTDVAAGPFDLIYAAGLYDYLDAGLAEALTKVLFERLAPGGELLIANFLPDIPDAGYMECYMGWKLIYRSSDETRSLARSVDVGEIAESYTYILAGNDICYLRVQKS